MPLTVDRIKSISNSTISKTESKETNEEESETASNKPQNRKTTGLIYKSGSYPNGCFNVDLTSSESALALAQEKATIYLVYVDSLSPLKSEAIWPELLTHNASPALKQFSKTANLLVVDSAAKTQSYERALECNLQETKKSFDFVLPCCTFRQQEFLARLNINTFIRLNQTTSLAEPEQISLKEADLSSITRAFHNLYPAYSPGDSLPQAVINRALSQFDY